MCREWQSRCIAGVEEGESEQVQSSVWNCSRGRVGKEQGREEQRVVVYRVVYKVEQCWSKCMVKQGRVVCSLKSRVEHCLKQSGGRVQQCIDYGRYSVYSRVMLCSQWS